ncbi:MAG: tetratricopeptide repeat protein [Oligoflexia bacterium]|nr:tetratricopeptide repeat protein [Oligoflexia bacterium]
MTEKRKDILFLIFIFIITTISFSLGFEASYVNWDDNVLILDNILLRQPLWVAVKSAFGHYYFSDYLPVTLMSLWLDIKIFGYNSSAQHVVNLGLHLSNIALFFYFLSLLKLPKIWIYIIVAVFAFHPVQTEVLMWVSNRNILLATPLMLVSSILILRSNSKINFLVGSLFYVLSILCKSVSVLVPFLWICIELFLMKRTLNSTQKYASFLLIIVAGLFVRVHAYSEGIKQNFSAVTFDITRIAQLPVAMFNALALYIKMFFYPTEYSIIYPRFSLTMNSIVAALTVFVFSMFLIWRYVKTKKSEYIFFISLILIFLIPVLQILPRLSYVNDRYMYIPIIGFVGLLLTLLQDLCENFKIIKLKYLHFVICILIIPLPFFSYARSQVWLGDRQLWEDTVEKIPTSQLARGNLALAYYREGHYLEAVSLLKTVFSFDTDDGSVCNAYNNLAAIYSNSNAAEHFDINRALALLEEGVKRCVKIGDTFLLRLNMALMHKNLRHNIEAKKILLKLKEDLIEASSIDQRFQLISKRVDALINELSL